MGLSMQNPLNMENSTDSVDDLTASGVLRGDLGKKIT